MSQGKVLETLFNLGFTEFDAKVYVFLAKKGPQKASSIAKSLKIRKQTLYLILKKLENKGIVSVSLERPARFSALPIEKILDLFINAKMEEAQLLEQKRSEILSDWKAISIEKDSESAPKFMVIEGRNYIYSRIQQMIQETKEQLSLITTVSGLVRADQFGVIDTAKCYRKRKIKFRFLTELSKRDIDSIKALLQNNTGKTFHFEGRVPDLGQRLTNRIIIKDEDEAMFFISTKEDFDVTEQEGTCLWTNSKTLVQAFTALFEELWHKSTDLRKKIHELETGKPTPKTYVISDPDAAERNYYEKMNTAKEEIIMITSSEGLIDSSRSIPLLNKKIGKCLSIKIMAPITNDNLGAALQLSKCCNVRHVPTNYLRTTVVDSQHLYQFKNPPADREKGDLEPSFENTFYTNDLEYVGTTKKMLEDLWKNARVPSAVTLEEITRSPVPTVAPISDDEYSISRKDSPYRKLVVDLEEKGGLVTAEHVLNKIINAKRIPAKNPLKDIVRLYGSMASAVIHAPNNLNLPDMIMVFYHCNKQSSFGAEDWFQVYLWLETPKGHTFVPVAVVGDNPRSVKWRKVNYYTGTPAAQNCRLLRKDELQIQVHGNTLFAGWTVPIPLLPNKYILPPAGVLFEGYSRLKTVVTKSVMPSGVKVVIEGNGFDAFVTLFHPKSKYAGPGTDGTIGRDMILTTYPPA